jgi:hypothetical protein
MSIGPLGSILYHHFHTSRPSTLLSIFYARFLIFCLIIAFPLPFIIPFILFAMFLPVTHTQSHFFLAVLGVLLWSTKDHQNQDTSRIICLNTEGNLEGVTFRHLMQVQRALFQPKVKLSAS